MPMWCPSSDAPQPSECTTQPHHRIVRIPPGECVVLNSAERAPYLLLIEILHDDLDFDPTKRNNKEVLEKIVTKEDERTGASGDLISFTTSPAPRRSRPHSDQVASAEAVLGEESTGDGDTPVAVVPMTPVTLSPDEEEIDLVEQLYGTDHSFRSRAVDISESIVLPPAPKNKELDMAAWSRPSSISLVIESSPSVLPTPLGHSRSSHPRETTPTINGDSQLLSLDDYSERMRTAAIMLSQLNANLVREPVTPVSLPGMSPNPAESDAAPGSNWIPRSGRLLSSTERRGHLPSTLTGGSNEFRMKLQHSEAAAIRDRIMKEMLALEDERMERMREHRDGEGTHICDLSGDVTTAEDEGIIRRELNKADPSVVVFSESWAAKKVFITMYSGVYRRSTCFAE